MTDTPGGEPSSTPLTEALEAEMVRRGITATKAAELCHTSQQNFGKWLHGTVRQPNPEAMTHIAKFLRLSPDEAETLRAASALPLNPRGRQTTKRRVEALETQVDDLVRQLHDLVRRLDALGD